MMTIMTPVVQRERFHTTKLLVVANNNPSPAAKGNRAKNEPYSLASMALPFLLTAITTYLWFVFCQQYIHPSFVFT
jgi:hypothetical protein